MRTEISRTEQVIAEMPAWHKGRINRDRTRRVSRLVQRPSCDVRSSQRRIDGERREAIL